MENDWLTEALRLATENVAAGGGPFGAIVVRDGSIIATGTNQVTPTLDPTAHAESSRSAQPAKQSATSA
jgi:tRNA(Arg) A34 adenosine deaminase TadA